MASFKFWGYYQILFVFFVGELIPTSFCSLQKTFLKFRAKNGTPVAIKKYSKVIDNY